MATKTTHFGKRALNKAQTRLNILNAVYRLGQDVNFSALKVKDIADSAGITEMTFFNYFQKKEDILRYMMGLWVFEFAVEQHRSPLNGEPAIRQLFNHSAQFFRQHARLMANFVAMLVTSEIEPTATTVDAADRYLLYPDIPELHHTALPSGNDILMYHLVVMNRFEAPSAVLLQLASAFYGDIIVAHTAQLDLAELYSASLDRILAVHSTG